MAKQNVRKELHLHPYELVAALQKAGLCDDTCQPNVQVVEKTEVNEGRTVIVSWSLREERVVVVEGLET
jgi:hypothetical protein